MKKIVNRVISQIIAIAVSVQMIGQYGASLIPQINAVGDEVQSEVSEVEEETVETESSDETVETEAEPELAVNEVSDDREESETIAESEYEDWNVTSDTTLNEMKEVNNLTISSGTLNLNGQKVIVHGDLILTQKGRLNCNKGEISCENFTMSNSSYLYMTNTNDLLVVNGNFTHNGGYFKDNNAVAGTVEIKGDFFSEGYGFSPNQEQKVILSGTTRQTINFKNNSYGFNILEINNTSREGVYSPKAVLANEINLMNDCEIDFAGCTEYGKTLDGDLSIDGDYCLGAGILNLGNHNMTINGNLIQGGGTIKLGTGTLTVNKDYRIQSRTEKENVAEDETEKYNYGRSTGSLEMMNEKCSLIVKGNFITQSTVNHRGKLTAGTMEIDGNFKQISSDANSENFISTENHIVKFSGENKQNIEFQTPSNSCFCNLEINNDKSINFQTNVYAYGKIYDKSGKVSGNGYLYISNLEQIDGHHFSGKVNISNTNSNQKLEYDLTVGSIEVNYLHVNGNVLTADNITVNNGLYVEGGTVDCKNNLAFNRYSIFTMNAEKSYVLIGGNFYNYSYYCSSWELTEGILDIKGDFIQTENSQFVCKDNHVTVLTSKKLPGGRDYTQTIKFYEPGKSKFNILRITKPKSKYVVLNSSNKQVSFDLIYNKLEENYTDELALFSVLVIRILKEIT